MSDPLFSTATLLDAFLERSVDLGDGERPSQTDLMAIVRLEDRLGILAIEAKVDEPFGPTVDKWLMEAKGDGHVRQTRLKILCGILGLDVERAGPIRYQLIHRSASAVIEAKRYCANDAAMLVQSFCPNRSWFDDYQVFVRVMGMNECGLLAPERSKPARRHSMCGRLALSQSLSHRRVRRPSAIVHWGLYPTFRKVSNNT
jgi:hypothetical protein